jgi:hypothetical protein
MANENQSGDLAAIIRNLKARRADLDTSIASLERAYGSTISDDGLSSPIVLNGADQLPTELPRGAFLGKSLPAAVKLYLSAMKKKQTIREIATALREGGVESTSDNFENVITGCLNRMKSNGELLRFKDGWGLPEFYPESLRARLSQEGVPKRISAKKKDKKRKSPLVAKPAVSEGTKPGSGESLDQRIEKISRLHPGERFTYQEIANALPDVLPKVVALTLGRMAKSHGWEKGKDGKYRLGVV